MNENIEKIKNIIKRNVGTMCTVVSKQGRKKVVFENCIILSAYPEVFVLTHTDPKTNYVKKITFSYTEILTKKVFLTKVREDLRLEGA